MAGVAIDSVNDMKVRSSTFQPYFWTMGAHQCTSPLRPIPNAHTFRKIYRGHVSMTRFKIYSNISSQPDNVLQDLQIQMQIWQTLINCDCECILVLFWGWIQNMIYAGYKITNQSNKSVNSYLKSSKLFWFSQSASAWAKVWIHALTAAKMPCNNWKDSFWKWFWFYWVCILIKLILLMFLLSYSTWCEVKSVSLLHFIIILCKSSLLS